MTDKTEQKHCMHENLCDSRDLQGTVAVIITKFSEVYRMTKIGVISQWPVRLQRHPGLFN